MEGILQAVLRPISATIVKAVPKKDDALIEEIESVKAQLKNAQNRFNLFTDFDMTDSCIYEMEALEARYRYLIKQAKEKNISYFHPNNIIKG